MYLPYSIVSNQMLSEKELLQVMALLSMPNFGDTLIKKLIHRVGSVEGIFKEKKSKLEKIEGVGPLRIKGLNPENYLKRSEREWHYMQEQGIAYRYFLDANYPKRLLHCMDGPVLFFQKGHIDLENKKLLSIVGTRRATRYGIDFCESFLDALQSLNPVVVSGFAYGIDITAQKKAAELGLQTVGCLAHGFDEVYPKTHKRYMDRFMEHGGFITEFWSDDLFDRKNFLRRNRIIAGLSEATIVVESAEKGGSLVTADIAHSYNREVFAVPGRADDPQSKGCNDLIKSQKAHMLTSAADLVYVLNWQIESQKPKAKQPPLFVELIGEEKIVYEYLKLSNRELLDIIAIDCGLPVFKVAGILLNLEMKGLIRPLPGKVFEAV